MVTFLLKKSYRLKDLQEIDFKDLWGDHGIFTTMWIFGKPPKILFFKNHLSNLLKSLKKYKINKRFIKSNILQILNKNLSKKKNYNHLLRIALNKNTISISLRKRLTPKLNFNLKLVNLKRERPQFKNLKYKKILSHLSKMDNSQSDILKIINKNLSKKRKYNHLLRIAINKKIISISLRKRVKPKLNFNLKLVKLKREKPEFKNLKYKKILSYLSKMDNSQSDIALVYNKKLLETGTSNLLFVKDQKFFTPKKDYYEGNTYKFFKTKITKIFKKDILLKEIKNYDEILLIGSGKGVASVRTINELKWKRKNLKTYNNLNKIFLKEIKRNKQYVF